MRMIRTILFLALVSCAFLGHAEEAAEAPAPEPPAPVCIDQVQIQIWISETNEDGLRDLGTNLDYTRFYTDEGVNHERSGSLQRVSTQFRGYRNPLADDPVVADPRNANVRPVNHGFDLPLRQQADLAPLMGNLPDREGFGLQANIMDEGFGSLDIHLRALEQNGDLDLISKPEILVINNTVAQIHAGDMVPYQDLKYSKGVAALSMTWRDVGVNMKLQPLILSEEFVQIAIQELNVTDYTIDTRIIQGNPVDLPVFSQRSQTGVVNVPNGHTLVIGGLASNNLTIQETRVPILGAVPILGIPFRGRKTESSERTLLIFVSPTIVDLRDMSDKAFSALNFWRESRWQGTERIQNEIDALENEL